MIDNHPLTVSQDERERAIARSRRMYQTDLASNLATVEDRGIQQGSQMAKLEVARSMIADAEPVEKIIKYTGLSREKVEDLQLD